MLLRLEKIFDRFSDVMGWIAGILNLVMLLNVFYDSIMRYFFRSGSIALQEMEWHLFAMVFLFGIAYALKEDGHVQLMSYTIVSHPAGKPLSILVAPCCCCSR